MAGDTVGGETIAHPLGILLLVICAMVLMKQPRERLMLPLILFMIAIPSAQRVVIATLDFSFVRILIILLLVRMVIRHDHRYFKQQKPDVTLFWWMGCGIITYGLLIGNISGAITRTGYMFDTVGAYYLGRVYIQTTQDIQRIAVVLGFVAIPTLIFFLIERSTSKNMFYLFGGVPEYSMIRNGRLRCQGPFSHPIMAGVFWASLLPWLIAIWQVKTFSRSLLYGYILCILIIILNTASSTPVMAILFTILGTVMFKLRHKMPLIRKLLLLLLVTLHLVMKAPIWHLISRIDLSGGSTGWHRFNLIEQAINHIDEWWLIGSLSTGHWGWGTQDITNQYLLEGIRGGFLGMVLFIVFIRRVYLLLGEGQRQAKTKADLWILWASGVMLFTHIMSFLAVSYFGQTNTALFLFIGGSVSAAVTVKQTSLRQK
jgi:hypothetical protein